MAGFEVVVRPAVFPNIRPAPAQVLAPPDDPSKGVAVFSGTSGSLIDLPESAQSSWSSQRHKENLRTFEKVKIAYTRPDGTIDWSQWTEVEIVTHMDFSPTFSMDFDRPPMGDNMQLIGSYSRYASAVG